VIAGLNREQFKQNPSLFLEKAIKEHIVGSPDNCFQALDDGPIFDEPLVGFADGDAPIFQDYKKIIGDFHLPSPCFGDVSPKLLGE